jgi:spermidine synthase
LRIDYGIVFVCFFVSGFCSLLYQVLWTRLAFAHFGIITPVLSVVVSVFMLGLGIGSAYGGRLADRLAARWGISPLFAYAAAEAAIALGAFAVPAAFDLVAALLLRAGTSNSLTFLLASAIGIALTLLPWCVAMGLTIPLMMRFVRAIDGGARTSFSFLYAANVLGATAGALLTALVLIETLGLRGTYELGAACNLAIATLAVVLAVAVGSRAAGAGANVADPPAADAAPGWVARVLFVTGFSSLGMEVCWARDFTFELLTTIYAFGAILATYLLATFVGSIVYRTLIRRHPALPIERTIAWLFPLALLPVLLADPRLDRSVVQTLVSIVPLCGLLGFLTPGLIDRFARGDATRAGRYYALNIVGGVLGPLVAGYLLLPLLGIRWAIVVLALPFALIAWTASSRERRAGLAFAAAVPVLAVAVLFSRAYDDGSIYVNPHEVRRDYAAAVVAFGSGRDKALSVNAIPITALTTDTKVMAHLPMVLAGSTRRALDICFGMGTTFRSLATWHADTTAVDLSPSVIASFGFFHRDAAHVLAQPNVRAVADDGRRYLMRSGEQYDVITVDPPPPVEAAGSSLLYSLQFYELVKRRLAPGGVLAQWLPRGEPRIAQSVALALDRSFPYVRAFPGENGMHFIASMQPIVMPSAREFVRRMPPQARRDLIEWKAGSGALKVAAGILASEIPFATLLPPPGSGVPALSDDVPYNEYFFLRRGGFGQVPT